MDSGVGWSWFQIPDLLFVNWVILITFLDLPKPQFAYQLHGAAHRTCLMWILHEKRCDMCVCVCVRAPVRIYPGCGGTALRGTAMHAPGSRRQL